MPTSSDIAALRTLALVGPATAGKTSLAEALLWKAGAIGATGSVERGTTVSDYDPLEKKAQRSKMKAWREDSRRPGRRCNLHCASA